MAKTVKATNEVALSGQFNITEEGIPAMLKQITERISQLTGSKEKKSRLSGQLMGETLSEVKDVNKLQELYAYITKKGAAIEENRDKFLAVSPIQLKEYMEEGGTVGEWQEAILEQYANVTHEEELQKLKKTKIALEECLSEEAKKKARLESIGVTLKEILSK